MSEETFYYRRMADFESSSFAQAAYYNAGKLIIETVHGDILGYEDVPEEVFNGFESAESSGRFYHDKIRGKFPRIEPGTLFFVPIEELWAKVDVKKDEIAEARAQGSTEDQWVKENLGENYEAGDYTLPNIKGRRYTVIANFDSLEAAMAFLPSAYTEATSISLHIDNDADE